MKYTVTLTVCPEPALLARITVLLRKYDIQINHLERTALTGTAQEKLTLEVQPSRANFTVAMKKLERLVPIVTISYTISS